MESAYHQCNSYFLIIFYKKDYSCKKSFNPTSLSSLKSLYNEHKDAPLLITIEAIIKDVVCTFLPLFSNSLSSSAVFCASSLENPYTYNKCNGGRIFNYVFIKRYRVSYRVIAVIAKDPPFFFQLFIYILTIY